MRVRKKAGLFLAILSCLILAGCEGTSELPLPEPDDPIPQNNNDPAPPGKLPQPEFSPADGTEIPAAGLDVTLSCTDGATIYFTRDGSEPSPSAELYFLPIHLTKTTTLKACAFKKGMIASEPAIATFTRVGPNPDPTPDPEPEIESGPTKLHIVATIDGRDELHISPNRAGWQHHDWDYPTQVRINGRDWNPQATPVWEVSPEEAFLSKNIDLSGAVLTKLHGRGDVRLSYADDGLVIHFDDNDGGAGDYDLVISFAEMLCKQSKSDGATASKADISVTGRIEGSHEMQFVQNRVDWKHHGYPCPASIVVNNGEWNPREVSFIMPEEDLPFFPDTADLTQATLTKVAGRGDVRLDFYKDQLILAIQDMQPGDDYYDLLVHIPLLKDLKLVRLTSCLTDELMGAPVTVLKYAADGSTFQRVPGQRVFDSQGECQLALPAGTYRFEVLHQPTPGVLVALRTNPVTVDADTTISLDPASVITPKLLGPDCSAMTIDEWAVRSILPQGQIVCSKSTDASWTVPTLILSPDQSYAVRVLGHQHQTYAALWVTQRPAELASISCAEMPLIRCNFLWAANTPAAIQKGVTLHFPTSRMEIPDPQSAILYTNRQFLGLSYWLEFPWQYKAVFHPRSYSIPTIPSSYSFTIGGSLRTRGSAAIMKGENRMADGSNAPELWWDITLQDPQGYLLNKTESKLNWQQEITLRDGGPIPPNPLTDSAIAQLGNLTDTLTLRASYLTRSSHSTTTFPSAFVQHGTAHHRMTAPDYMDWQARSYLAKMERSFQGILAVTGITPDPSYQVEIKWWLVGNVALGGYGAVVMPFNQLRESNEWFVHPWAITHEMLHGFGYPHGWQLNRIDFAVQDQFEDFRYNVADHPEYVP